MHPVVLLQFCTSTVVLPFTRCAAPLRLHVAWVGVCRFNSTASRNWERMKSTAGQAYSMTIKPLIDKLSGDQ